MLFAVQPTIRNRKSDARALACHLGQVNVGLHVSLYASPTRGTIIVTTAPRGPLQGIRVLDLTTVMLGPFGTQILGEMGADVVKIEAPGGDIGRWTGVGKSPGMSAAHMMKGRNKRSVILDLKNEKARDPLRRLVETADVFVHNIRPQAARRLGIDYESIAGWKGDIVYAASTGYGEAGPYVDKPAYDDLIQGASGLAALFGSVTGTPRYGPSVLADKTVGLYLTYAITMALLHRERTGEGQRVHVPMYEAFASFMMNEHMQGQTFDPPVGPAGYQRLLTPHRRPYPTADGHICVLPYNDKHWRRFFELTGRPELEQDERFVDQSSRSKNIDALYEIVGEMMTRRTSAEWQELLDAADIPVMPMNTPEDLFECPHLKAVGMFPEVDHPTEGRIRHIKVPVHFSKTPGGYYRHAEQPGQSTETVLSEVGYEPDEIAALWETGAVGKPS
jgi:crotonobetainyl-CoA:carnitine CoA-transferase CaiB-like acyl-CoA transferase